MTWLELVVSFCGHTSLNCCVIPSQKPFTLARPREADKVADPGVSNVAAVASHSPID
jgi:hypothetical protein